MTLNKYGLGGQNCKDATLTKGPDDTDDDGDDGGTGRGGMGGRY